MCYGNSNKHLFLIKVLKRLKHWVRITSLRYFLLDPSIILSVSKVFRSFYLLKTFERVSELDFVPCLYNFFPASFLNHLKEKRIYHYREGIGEGTGFILYQLIRNYKPKIVVETGVAKGLSSAFILCAMNENFKGYLYSIDLPPWSVPIVKTEKAEDFDIITLEDKGIYTIDKEYRIGCLVPEYLRRRWSLIVGDSRKELPLLLQKIGKISIFLHDSLHTYSHMLFEYETAWPHIEKGGFLLSDDVTHNNAFFEFCKKVNIRPILYHRFGVIRKST